ncbi:MAG: acyl transferase, partial [Bacteroidota bacterium]|nr:acyl transferase [Bacteroidota bacterium]
MNPEETFFNIRDLNEFNHAALRIFQFQYRNLPVYRKFVDELKINPINIHDFSQIPCIPISLFKIHDFISEGKRPEKIFLSSGTTGISRSRHLVADLDIYRTSLRKSFSLFYGLPMDYTVFGLMPSPEDNPDSSLIFMVNDWIETSREKDSGFYGDRFPVLAEQLQKISGSGKKAILIGLSYLLLDLAEQFPMPLKNVIVMETGGMKGKRREMIREELHGQLKEAFSLPVIHSEYSMAELLSQAFSCGNGQYQSPPWMKILIRDPADPLSPMQPGRTGGINILDL